jgi:hypothetical protein
MLAELRPFFGARSAKRGIPSYPSPRRQRGILAYPCWRRGL